MKLLELFIAICVAPFLVFGAPKDESNNTIIPKYTCNEDAILNTECKDYAEWKEERDRKLTECYMDSDKFYCKYDEYPGTTLHWKDYSYLDPSDRISTHYTNDIWRVICKDGLVRNLRDGETSEEICGDHGGIYTQYTSP